MAYRKTPDKVAADARKQKSILAYVDRGWTLERIGKKFSITRSRVHQIDKEARGGSATA